MKLGKNSKYFYSAKSEASFSKEYHVTITLPRDDKWRTLRLKSWRCKRSVQKGTKRTAKSFETFQGRVKIFRKRIGISILSLSGTNFSKFSLLLEFLSSRSSFERSICF